MARTKKGSDLSLSGPSLASRFALTMTIVLAVVMLAAGAFLYSNVLGKAQEVQENTFVEAVQLQGPLLRQMKEDQQDEIKEKVFGVKPDPSKPRIKNPAQVAGTKAESLANGEVHRMDVDMYAGNSTTRGSAYIYKDLNDVPLLVPLSAKDRAGEGLLSLILGVTVIVILVGAIVAYAVGSAAARPLERIVGDIDIISRGDLGHRIHVRAGGEIMLLGRSIDRMAVKLAAAQAAQLELAVREREIGLAGEVREALLPETTPQIAGYDLGALHVDSPTPGGDFHDFLELGDGRVGLLVCDVSGRGIPGAMIGAIARSYLRVELSLAGDDVAGALVRVNAELARDVRRGIYVTAMYVLVDSKQGIATVACAGHRMPLIRYAAADKKIRLVQSEGIALGLDKGAVFTRTLQIQKIPIDPGDRIVIANTGPVGVKSEAGEELGEKAFYRQVLQHASMPTAAMLEKVKSDLQSFAGRAPFPNDISIVSLRRA